MSGISSHTGGDALRNQSASAFGIGRTRTLHDVEVADIRHLVADAARRARELVRLFDDWQRSAGLNSEVTISPADPRVAEIYLTSERALPYRKMASLAGQSIHAGRSALDHLNTAMMRKFASGDYDDHKTYFPITDSGKDWRSWRSRHSALPDWVQDRYKELQPGAGPFKGLRGLQALDNLGKHRDLIPIRVAVVGSYGSGETTLAGIVDEDAAIVSLDAISNEITRDVRRLLAAKITYAAPIERLHQDESPELEIDPLFYFGAEHYTLREIAELPNRVDAAISYAATGEPSHLAAYQAPFEDPLVRTEERSQ